MKKTLSYSQDINGQTQADLAKIIETYAKNNHLEIIFSEGHHLYDKIFYDAHEGKYYNRETDFFLSENELDAFGLGASPRPGISFEFFNKCASM